MTFYGEDESAPATGGDNPIPAAHAQEYTFRYDPRAYDTSVRVWDRDYGMEFEEQAPLQELLNHTSEYYGLSPNLRDIDRARSDIAYEYWKQMPNRGWWFELQSLEEDFPRIPFIEQSPTEQYIVGQEGRGVRFYNFAAPMDQERLADCRKFVDILTQYFGDRTYDFVTDVVITDFTQSANKPRTNGVTSKHGQVMYINAALLEPDNQSAHHHIKAAAFLKTLVHESGHLIHGFDTPAQEQLLKFAKTVGWDVDAMLKEVPDWQSEYADVASYGPPDEAYAVTLPGGTQKHMDRDEAEKHGVWTYDANGKRVGPDYYHVGSPSLYGATRPQETSAETTAYSLLGNFVTQRMPETRDAWLEHMQQRVLLPGETPEDRPLATPLNRAPIEVDHRVGNDIVYPRTKLPEKIYVKLRPEAPAVAASAR